MHKNILLIAGGDSSEHEISLISAKYIAQKLKENPEYNVINAVLHNNQLHLDDGSTAYFGQGARLISDRDEYLIDCVVPCLLGFPGETGDIQAFLMLHQVPFISCEKEASINCFNKITTKLWLNALGIENTPSMFIADASDTSLKRAHQAFAEFGRDVYVKAASQGSSIGCYHVTDESKLDDAIREALGYSKQVLIEMTVPHRELEVAVYEYDGEVHATNPGEIIIPDGKFYTFDEKYSADSQSVTAVGAEGLTSSQLEAIKATALCAFKGLGLRHLSRVDFFLSTDGKLYLNEINTFPGMTPTSMFPKMVENAGVSMTDFFTYCIEDAIKAAKSGS